MNQDVLVFEVGESGFDRYVIENSHKLPVLVEFMGVWSETCVSMADTIHDLAQEFAGQFVFAKVDVDEQPGLRTQYNIQNIPTLLVFRNGEVAFSQQGQIQETELRVLLKGMGIYRESDELRDQARNSHMSGDTPEAIALLTLAIQLDPTNTRVAMDMVQIFIDMEELEQASELFYKLPEQDSQSSMGKSLLGQLTFAELAAKTDGSDSLSQKLQQNETDHDARFDLALCLVAKHDYDEAIEHLFTLLRLVPEFRDGAPREMIITITNMLVPNNPELAQGYRRRLANLMSE